MTDKPPALVIQAEATNGGELHELMQANLVEADGKIDVLIACLKNFIKGKFWKGFFCKSLGSHVEFDSFEAYVTDKNLGGMSLTVERLRNLVKHDTDTLALVNKTLEKPHGGATYSPPGTNTHTKNTDVDMSTSVDEEPAKRTSPTGNSKEAIKKRLRKRGRDDLADMVDSGEMTAQDAGRKAGISRPRFTTFCDNPEEAAQVIFKKFSKDHVRKLIEELQALLEA